MATDFEQLYQTYFMQVYSYVMTLAKSQDLSEEITQRTFFKAMTAGKPYRGDPSEFVWLCAIAKNLLIDELRKQKQVRGHDTQDSVSDSDLETTFADEDSAFRIHQVLHELEEPYKEVFQLRVFGELFDKTENWARVTYHRARLKLQERMKGL